MPKVILLFGMFTVLLLTASSSLSVTNQKEDPFSWTNGYSLIVTSDLTDDQAQTTVDFITENGGQIAIVVSPRMLLGWANASLAGRHGILAVHNRPVPPGLLKNLNVDEVDHVSFFNQVVSGKWRADKSATYSPMQWSKPDTVVRPGAKMGELLPSENIAPSFPGTSDFMAGKVKYNVFFVESNGLSDPNMYSWTCANLSTAVSEIAAGLSFWSSKAATYGVPLSFSTTYSRPPATGCAGTTKVLQPYEPILHAGPPDDGLWVSAIMCNFGQCSGDKWTQVNNYNQASRVSSKTNWATSLFMAYNPSPAPTTFTDGYFAYAWVPNGPYTQLLFRNNGWAITQIDQVTSHETGHLFGANDEYAASGCSNCASGDASTKMVVNGNCENCNANSAPCMMKGNTLNLCGYTPGQIGWGVNLKYVQTMAGSVQKSNYVPGQDIKYQFQVDIPGRPGEDVLADFRWYIQFPGDQTEHWAYTDFHVTSGATWNIWITWTVPTDAKPGESLVEVQLELRYASGYYYGKGIRSSNRGKFFILPVSANSIPSSPLASPGLPEVHAEMVH